jgi:hypothetical protein
MKKAGGKMSAKNRNKKATGQSEVKSYGNEPFFAKKANESKKFLEKHGVPEGLKRAFIGT